MSHHAHRHIYSTSSKAPLETFAKYRQSWKRRRSHPDFITSDIEAKNLQLIYQYGEGLKEVQQLFSRDRHQSMAGKFYAREGPPLYVNMPPVSGAPACRNESARLGGLGSASVCASWRRAAAASPASSEDDACLQAALHTTEEPWSHAARSEGLGCWGQVV